MDKQELLDEIKKRLDKKREEMKELSDKLDSFNLDDDARYKVAITMVMELYEATIQSMYAEVLKDIKFVYGRGAMPGSEAHIAAHILDRMTEARSTMVAIQGEDKGDRSTAVVVSFLLGEAADSVPMCSAAMRAMAETLDKTHKQKVTEAGGSKLSEVGLPPELYDRLRSSLEKLVDKIIEGDKPEGDAPPVTH